MYKRARLRKDSLANVSERKTRHEIYVNAFVCDEKNVYFQRLECIFKVRQAMQIRIVSKPRCAKLNSSLQERVILKAAIQ